MMLDENEVKQFMENYLKDNIRISSVYDAASRRTLVAVTVDGLDFYISEVVHDTLPRMSIHSPSIDPTMYTTSSSTTTF